MAGHTHLKSEQREERGVIPCCVLLFSIQAALFGSLPFEKVDADMAEDAEILVRVTGSDPALVFCEAHIQ